MYLYYRNEMTSQTGKLTIVIDSQYAIKILTHSLPNFKDVVDISNTQWLDLGSLPVLPAA